MVVNLAPGRFYAGIDRPWIVSQNAVRNALAEYGLRDVRFHDRNGALPVSPQDDPSYSDDWDEWVEATYAGPARQIDPTRRWAWLVFVPETAPASSPVPGAEPIPVPAPVPAKLPTRLPTAQTAMWIGAGAAALLVLARARRVLKGAH